MSIYDSDTEGEDDGERGEGSFFIPILFVKCLSLPMMAQMNFAFRRTIEDEVRARVVKTSVTVWNLFGFSKFCSILLSDAPYWAISVQTVSTKLNEQCFEPLLVSLKSICNA